MGYDDFDDDEYSDYDDMGDIFILDEMDREDEQMNRISSRGNGCLSVMILFIAIPTTLVYFMTKLL